MRLEELITRYSARPQIAALARLTGDENEKNIAIEGLAGSACAAVFAALASKTMRTILFVLRDAEEAGYFYHDLTQMMGTDSVLFLPSSYRRAVKYGQRDAANEILRTEVMARVDAERLYVVSYPEAVAEQVVSRNRLDERMVRLQRGETHDVSQLTDRLVELGFSETDYVYEPGQFAQRGSILDVFSFSSEYPVRIDFFGDEIDSIRSFEVESQLSRDKMDHVEIVPELSQVFDDRVSLLSFLPRDTIIATREMVGVREAIEKTYAEGFSVQATTERLAAAPEAEREQVEREMRKELQLIGGQQFWREVEGFRKIEWKAAAADKYDFKPTTSGSRKDKTAEGRLSVVRFNCASQPLFHKNFELLEHTLSDYGERGYQLFILADSQKQNERLREIFASDGGSKIEFVAVEKTLHEGFIDHDAQACFFTDHQIFDRFHKYSLKSDRVRSSKVTLTLKELKQFQLGDYVVHIDHGIGQFGGLVRMPQAGGYQEMIKIIYQKGDAVYVSIHSLYKVSKYKGRDDGQKPRISALGTGQWQRMKERTKEKLKEIARDLILLYARRRQVHGFAFSHDSFMQHELEASFLYEDTPDQLKATNDVKADMESDRPMDRLVCGDVGFGKTEVAVRAAFKAACDSKQVAVLVPTTVLAYQHYQTFRDRLKDFPVRVDYLSRARTAKQTREVLKDLADGRIDIIIGTHKLIGKSVKFKDLGLLIIDEEQKFGVTTKEKLRQMKSNVDTLTMSATPIPRTLQFSLVGARDLSVIQTPPPNRYPIQTELHTFSPEIIRDAINFEMSRNGQVFFVSNRINSLPHIAETIHREVPDARIAIGHGQMKPEELEQVIMGFINYDYDVLLSTTIVENGIDIPNANTIIINSAQNFGLSDLHQMRGRVGRSNKKAFCYLLAPPLSVLNSEAKRRLEALENFSDLGSGINIAMQDLDIRGAGNLLGSEQSGFIADLGYETYQKILSQAVSELKNEEPLMRSEESSSMRREERGVRSENSIGKDEEGRDISHSSLPTSHSSLKKSHSSLSQRSSSMFVDDCVFESDLELYFPDLYVPNDSERMLLYRELDSLEEDAQVEAYRKRLIDRFGPVPQQGEELMRVVQLRRRGRRLGCEKIMLMQHTMRLFFVSRADSPYYQSDAFGRIIEYATTHVRTCQLREKNGRRSLLVSDVNSVGEALKILHDIEH